MFGTRYPKLTAVPGTSKLWWSLIFGGVLAIFVVAAILPIPKLPPKSDLR